MQPGVIALLVALAAATAAGFALRWNGGRFRRTPSAPPVPSAVPATPDVVAAPASSSAAPDITTSRTYAVAASVQGALTEADLGEALGVRATLVQFSTAFCAPCRPTRHILSQVASMVPGVRHVEIDATTRLDLVRRLRIASTPTILVLDQAGLIAQRASGQPRKADVIAALGRVIDD